MGCIYTMDGVMVPREDFRDPGRPTTEPGGSQHLEIEQRQRVSNRDGERIHQ